MDRRFGLKGLAPLATIDYPATTRLDSELERAKGFEPSTPTLARLCSTTELHPHPYRVAATRWLVPQIGGDCKRPGVFFGRCGGAAPATDPRSATFTGENGTRGRAT